MKTKSTANPSYPGARFHVMAKPIGPICNLDCTYCYYKSKEHLFSTENYWRMNDDVLEAFIRQYIQEQDHNEIIFSWQGGEPTLLGLDFFKKVIRLENKYRRPNQVIQNDLQTNGTLLNDNWCTFLRQHRFLVGLSVDGPQKLHDHYRLDKKGRATFDKVLAASRLLKKYRVPFNALTVVNSLNVKHPLEVYRFLRDELQAECIQFIPCVEPQVFTAKPAPYWEAFPNPQQGGPGAKPGGPSSVLTDWSVDADDYGAFLCKIFDEWLAKDIGKTFVTLFENMLSQWMGRPATACVFAKFYGKGMAIEHDGNVYSCDHYVYPDYRLGNIKKNSLATMASSKRQMTFGFDKKKSLPRQCLQCRYLFACNGECPKNRFIRTPTGEKGLNYLCSGLKKFFSHIDPYMQKLAKQY